MDQILRNAAEVSAGLSDLAPRLWRYCWALTGDRASGEDIAQSACLRALEKAEQYQPGTRLDSWVFSIARSIWLNQLRAEKVRRGSGVMPVEEIDLRDEKPSPESNIFYNQVFASIMSLPEAQRMTVLLVYVDGFSYKEAAGLLDVPIGTVMSRLAAARSRLAALRPDASASAGEAVSPRRSEKVRAKAGDGIAEQSGKVVSAGILRSGKRS